MKPAIKVHIGLHKTGTTSIQATLFRNRPRLLAAGINYLSLAENHSALLYPLFNNAPHLYRVNKAAGIDTEEKAANQNTQTEFLLRHALQENRSATFVISGEDLCALGPPGIARLRDWFNPYAADFRIVAYVRDPYATVNSLFQQRLRAGETWAQIVANPPRPRYQRIGHWIDAFGRQHVDIRLFDRFRFAKGNLIADFLDAVGAPPQLVEELDLVRANSSISREAGWLIDLINRSGGSRKLAAGLANIPGRRFVCPAQVFESVRSGVDEDLEWLRHILKEPVFAGTAPPRGP